MKILTSSNGDEIECCHHPGSEYEPGEVMIGVCSDCGEVLTSIEYLRERSEKLERIPRFIRFLFKAR